MKTSNLKDYHYMSCMTYPRLHKKGKGSFGLTFFKSVHRLVNCLTSSALIEITTIDKLNLDLS